MHIKLDPSVLCMCYKDIINVCLKILIQYWYCIIHVGLQYYNFKEAFEKYALHRFFLLGSDLYVRKT